MSYQLTTRHIRYFLAVAEELHFRKAADRLYISQPGLSKQIKEMEQGLGLQLFERHNRMVKLTAAGRYLQTELKEQLKRLEAIAQHAKLLHDGLRGNLRLGYVGSAMNQVIPDLMLRFRQQHPDILFDLQEMDNQQQIEGLLSNDLDFGFVRQERIPPGLAAHPVLEEAFCLVLPKNHPIQGENFESLYQFREESFILFDAAYSPSYYEKVMQIFDHSGFAPIVTHSTIHAGSIYKLIENNFGISIVPKSLQFDHLTNIQFIELTDIPQRTVLRAVWNDKNRNPIFHNFLEIVKSQHV
ncbi:MAG: LysR family transcriptional regulator [Bacteroidota bacterium]